MYLLYASIIILFIFLVIVLFHVRSLELKVAALTEATKNHAHDLPYLIDHAQNLTVAVNEISRYLVEQDETGKQLEHFLSLYTGPITKA
jgi:biopolymer transport protein ExbD